MDQKSDNGTPSSVDPCMAALQPEPSFPVHAIDRLREHPQASCGKIAITMRKRIFTERKPELLHVEQLIRFPQVSRYPSITL